jgi:hypothetical protein
MTLRYALRTVDGETVSITWSEFLASNRELPPETLDAIRALSPGETHRDGGGAQPEWSITREGSRATCYFCSAAWGACTCTFPVGAEHEPGFECRGVWVTDPSVSECGRSYVDPIDYYGPALRAALPRLLTHWRTRVLDPSRVDALAKRT